VSYTTTEGREQLLGEIGKSADILALALASLSEAYEQLDEHSAEELERDVFRPVQLAYGRVRRSHTEFAKRHDLQGRAFETAARAAPSHGAKELVESAAQAVSRADATLATLQDSMLPVEVGDPELRASLEEVRMLLADVGPRARALVRRFGR
jgi:hypothetical protein